MLFPACPQISEVPPADLIRPHHRGAADFQNMILIFLLILRNLWTNRRTDPGGIFSVIFHQKILKYTKYSCNFLISSGEKSARQSRHFDLFRGSYIMCENFLTTIVRPIFPCAARLSALQEFPITPAYPRLTPIWHQIRKSASSDTIQTHAPIWAHTRCALKSEHDTVRKKIGAVKKAP